MKNIKNYELFVESRKNSKNTIATNEQSLNEGVFTKISDTIKDMKKFFGDIWLSLKSKYGKHTWWYAGILLSQRPNNGSSDVKVQFWPYSINSSKAKKISSDIKNDKDGNDDYSFLSGKDIFKNEPSITLDDIPSEYTEMASDLIKAGKSFGKEKVSEGVVAKKHQHITNINGEELKKTLIDNYHMTVSRSNRFEKPMSENDMEKIKEINKKIGEIDKKISEATDDATINNFEEDKIKLKEKITAIRKKHIEERDERYYKKGTDKTSLFIWGAPGVAKTSIVKQTASMLGVDLIVWHLSLTEPSDLLGVPGVETDSDGKKRTAFYTPMLFPSSNGPQDIGAIIFFDEMNRASQSVLAGSLSLTLEGKIGTYVLPSKVLVIAAGNRPEDVGDGAVADLEPALMNRFEHVNLDIEDEETENWTETRADASEKPSKELQSYIDNWFNVTKKREQNVIPEIVAFVTAPENYEWFHHLDKSLPDSPWASPRSWTMASNKIQALGGIDKFENKDKLIDLVARFVGHEAALKFADFNELVKLFTDQDVENIFKEGAPKKPIPKRVDISRVVIYKISSYKRTDIKDIGKVPTNLLITEEEIKNFTTYMMAEKRTDIGVILLKEFLDNHPYMRPCLANLGMVKTSTDRSSKDGTTVSADLSEYYKMYNKYLIIAYRYSSSKFTPDEVKQIFAK